MLLSNNSLEMWIMSLSFSLLILVEEIKNSPLDVDNRPRFVRIDNVKRLGIFVSIFLEVAEFFMFIQDHRIMEKFSIDRDPWVF